MLWEHVTKGSFRLFLPLSVGACTCPTGIKITAEGWNTDSCSFCQNPHRKNQKHPLCSTALCFVPSIIARTQHTYYTHTLHCGWMRHTKIIQSPVLTFFGPSELSIHRSVTILKNVLGLQEIKLFNKETTTKSTNNDALSQKLPYNSSTVLLQCPETNAKFQ